MTDAFLKKRRKLNQREAESLIPVIREFNKVAATFLRILSKKVETKERKIAVMVTSMSIPQAKYNINIQTIDIRETIVTKRGEYTTNQSMSWEKDAMMNTHKGFII